jgi:hypothetical protein
MRTNCFPVLNPPVRRDLSESHIEITLKNRAVTSLTAFALDDLRSSTMLLRISINLRQLACAFRIRSGSSIQLFFGLPPGFG